MFTRESLLASDWYKERLHVKQRRDIEMWTRHVNNLQRFLDDKEYGDEAQRLEVPRRLEMARKKLAEVQEPGYVDSLVGTLGADPLSRATLEAEEPVVVWDKANLSEKLRKDTVKSTDESLVSYDAPTLLERVKSRFRRARLN
jgi:hypothetical protein